MKYSERRWKSMKVRVKLLGIISSYYPAYKEFCTIDVKEGNTIRELRKRLGLPETNVFINGKLGKENYELKAGDDILFLPSVGGG